MIVCTKIIGRKMKRLIKFIYHCSLVFYIVVLFWILFIHNRGIYLSQLPLGEYIKATSNFIPFRTISLYMKGITDGTMNIDIPIKNLIGNLLLFAPMGLYLTCGIKKISDIKNYIAFIIVILICIELGQLFLRRGSFDIDDFILNLTGAVLGYVAMHMKCVQSILVRNKIKS